MDTAYVRENPPPFQVPEHVGDPTAGYDYPQPANRGSQQILRANRRRGNTPTSRKLPLFPAVKVHSLPETPRKNYGKNGHLKKCPNQVIQSDLLIP